MSSFIAVTFVFRDLALIVWHQKSNAACKENLRPQKAPKISLGIAFEPSSIGDKQKNRPVRPLPRVL